MTGLITDISGRHSNNMKIKVFWLRDARMGDGFGPLLVQVNSKYQLSVSGPSCPKFNNHCNSIYQTGSSSGVSRSLLVPKTPITLTVLNPKDKKEFVNSTTREVSLE
ncbi:hypothetical protein BGZ80_010252 [Entomortierella chlamydospora]|uniref:Uncharacterized protein n=1 Tax=Entomortierella chlamydospora TaxID=101097 RepID=A0A9P6T051_9FUNG|nr:hypothetical protein BGZ80_010252 [Entomortierella chlamydospora]